MAELDYRARMEINEDDQTISLLDILTVLMRRRRLIVLFTTVVTLVAVGYFALTLVLPVGSPLNMMPNTYKPTVKVLLGESSKNNALSALSSANLGSLANLVSLGGGAASGTSADLAQALLKGRTIQDQIADEFGFVDRYRIKKDPKSSARSIVSSSMAAKFDSKSKILEISYKDTDRDFATEVVNRTVELLEFSFRKLTQDKVIRKKAYIEDSLKSVRAEVDRVTADLIAFQRKYRIVDLETQATQQVEMTAPYEASLIGKKYELQNLKTYLKEDDPQVLRLNNEIKHLEDFLNDIQTGSSSLKEILIPQQDIPGLSVDYLSIKRELEIQQTILSMLMSQYETTKLEEMDTSENFQVIEKAEVPERKDGPARAKMSVVAALSAAFLSVLIAFLAEYFSRVRKDPVESEKLARIISYLPGRHAPKRG